MKTRALLSLLALTGCGTVSTGRMDAAVDHWKGKPLELMVRSVGVPRATFDGENTTTAEWKFATPGAVAPADPYPCSVVATADKQSRLVTDVTYRGACCSPVWRSACDDIAPR